MRTKKLLSIALALAFLLPVMAVAEEGPVVWLSMVKAKPGQSQGLTQAIIKNSGPIYEKLIADGAALSWGVAQPITHVPGQLFSHVEFVVFPNWEGVNSFVTAFMGSMMAMSPEERAAQQEEFERVAEPGSHFDVVNRGVHAGGTSHGRPGYMNLAFFKVKPGNDFVGAFKEYGEPVLTQLSTDGKIGRFGIDVQEIHGDHSWTHLAWYEMPGLGARDAVDAAFEAADQARGDEGNAAMKARFGELFEPDSHRDDIAVIVHWSDGSGGGEGMDQ